MKDQEWTYEKSPFWGGGLWLYEPDKVQWMDKNAKLPCLALRNKTIGHWCGYVGVSESHPFFLMPYSDLENLIEVHGSISYSNVCFEDICHVVDEGENDKVWWIGFDCSHYGDLSPYTSTLFKNSQYDGTYKSLEFVKNECASLAKQLAAVLLNPNP